MSDNARELLREAEGALYDEMHGIHNACLTDGVERRNRKDALLTRIDTYLAAPSESAMDAARETAALRGLVRKMRIAGNMVRDAMPNSLLRQRAVHNWIDVCAEADKMLDEYTQATGGRW